MSYELRAVRFSGRLAAAFFSSCAIGRTNFVTWGGKFETGSGSFEALGGTFIPHFWCLVG